MEQTTMNEDLSAPETNLPGEDPAAQRVAFSLAISLIGLFIFAVGAKPSLFGWDRSAVVGFVQIAVFIFGLGVICIGGYIGMLTLWWGRERTIVSEIGTRIVATGYVISVFAGMADVFGMGSQPYPQTPYFGPLQSIGVLIGEIVIAIGFVLFIPYPLRKK